MDQPVREKVSGKAKVKGQKVKVRNWFKSLKLTLINTGDWFVLIPSLVTCHSMLNLHFQQTYRQKQ
jgi:hypothetical protein